MLNRFSRPRLLPAAAVLGLGLLFAADVKAAGDRKERDIFDYAAQKAARGVKPIAINDEWYYHMRFVEGMKGVTPILYAVPPLSTVQGGGKHSSERGGNPAVWADVASGKSQVMAWAYVRPDGGRGFGFT